jgi:hypothetical protein
MEQILTQGPQPPSYWKQGDEHLRPKSRRPELAIVESWGLSGRSASNPYEKAGPLDGTNPSP